MPSGIEVGGRVVPLYVGSVHYWRLDPAKWRACLESVKALGLTLVDTYVPWAVHEIAPGVFELGQTDPSRDVAAFLRLAHELGLLAIVRPGPHINAEMTCFGLPERIVWDPACQARSPTQQPVMLPMLPFSFPVPSYASSAFLDEATRYFQAIAPVLGALTYPDGPIVAVQIDNEGALYFRDGAYDQDYHPDAIALYRDFVRDKYQTLDALRAAYGPGTEASGELRFATLEPPVRFDATTLSELARHLDWAQFHEHLLSTAMIKLRDALERAGLSGVPTTHNLPLGQEATPLNAARVGRAVDLVGLDYYHDASPRSRAIIARRTTELAVRCEGLGVPPFACEMGAGFPPFFPPLDERDSAFTILAALAYGLRGFNVYMAVERDRWIGAPIDPHGRPRPFSTFWRRLCEALAATRFHELRRRAVVRILTPRSERRLTRVLHAFGPLTGAFFSVLGAGARESCREDDFGLPGPLAVEADAYAKAFEEALDARGVPVSHVGGEDRDVSLEGARWIVVASSGGLNRELARMLDRAMRSGCTVTIGPRAPELDALMRPLAEPAFLPDASPELLLDHDPATIDARVARAITEMNLPTLACDPDGVQATVHEDHDGKPRVLFLLNAGAGDVVARVTVGRGVTSAHDPLDDASVDVDRGVVEARVKPRTVRMLVLR